MAAKEAGRFFGASDDPLDALVANASGNTATAIYIDKLASSMSISDSIRNYWFFMPGVADIDKVRVVDDFNQGTGAAGSAYVTLDRPLSSASVANSQPIELHGMIDPRVVTSFINQGLMECFTETEFSVPCIAGNIQHSVAAVAPWCTDRDWIRWVGTMEAGEDRDQVDPFEDPGRYVYGNAKIVDGAVYLTHSPTTFTAGQVLRVKAVKPAYFACAPAGGAYGSQSGLALDTDICPIDPLWAAFAMLMIAARRGSGESSVTVRPEIRQDEARWATLFTDHRDRNFACPELRFMRPRFSSFGPNFGSTRPASLRGG